MSDTGNVTSLSKVHKNLLNNDEPISLRTPPAKVRKYGEDTEDGDTEEAIKALDHWWDITRKSALKSLNATKNDSKKVQSISSAIMLSS